MDNQAVVVFDKVTKEIVACIPLSGEKGICRKGVYFKIYNGTEPIFTETGNGVVLNESAFIWKGEQLC